MLLLSQKLLKVSNICSHANAIRQLHCQWRCGPADAKHAAKRCYHFLCFLTVSTPFINRQNNKDGKFKDCSRLFSSDNCGNLTGLCGIFFLHFLPDLWQIWTFKFPKVMRQHTEGVVGSDIWVYWKFRSFSSDKRILKINWDLTKLPPWVWWHPFLGHSVHILISFDIMLRMLSTAIEGKTFIGKMSRD